MSIDDRLRESMTRATAAAAPSADAWSSIELRVGLRKTRVARARAGVAVVAAITFGAAILWGALSLRDRHPDRIGGGTHQLAVSDIRVFAQPNFAKVGGVIRNRTDEVIGARVTCTLRDATGRIVGTAHGGAASVRPNGATSDRTIAFGATSGPATNAVCTVRMVAATRRPSPPPAPPSLIPAAVAFFDAEHGIVGGTMGDAHCPERCAGWLESTSDGGRTWSGLMKTPYPVDDVVVADPSDAWAIEQPCFSICDRSTLLHSSDGGRSWVTLGRFKIANPSFVPGGFGWAATRSGVARTVDGGRSWQLIFRRCPQFEDSRAYPAFVTPSHGWLLCAIGSSAGSELRKLYETTDGGMTWRKVNDSVLGGGSYAVSLSFRPDGKGWIGLGYGPAEVIITEDGGRHWHGGGQIDEPGEISLRMTFANDNVGFTLASRLVEKSCYLAAGLMKTTDGGMTWHPVHLWAYRPC